MRKVVTKGYVWWDKRVWRWVLVGCKATGMLVTLEFHWSCKVMWWLADLTDMSTNGCDVVLSLDFPMTKWGIVGWQKNRNGSCANVNMSRSVRAWSIVLRTPLCVLAQCVWRPQTEALCAGLFMWMRICSVFWIADDFPWCDISLNGGWCEFWAGLLDVQVLCFSCDVISL